MEPVRVCRVVVIDASAEQCEMWRGLLEERYRERVRVESFTDAGGALKNLGPDVHLLILDLDVPGVACHALFEAACAAGVDPKRIVITSDQPADLLHERCDDRNPLAVIEKAEPEQQAAFLMILDSVMKRNPVAAGDPR